MPERLRIGLTGGMGSGKSTAAEWLTQWGARVIDTDDVARELWKQPRHQAWLHHWTSELPANTPLPQRLRHLRQRLAHDAACRQAIEQHMHPDIQHTVAHRLAQPSDAPYDIVIIPLLGSPEQVQRYALDRVCVIDLDLKTQHERSIARDGDQDVIKQLIAHQPTRSQRLHLADDVIINDGSLQHLKAQVKAHHERWSTRSSSAPPPASHEPKNNSL